MIEYTCLANQWPADNFKEYIAQHIEQVAAEMPAGTDHDWIRNRILRTWLEAAIPAGNA